MTMPTRPLGRTGADVSILCLGGWHIRTIPDDGEAVAIMHAALDGGMTFFDNAWDYHDGASEELMGKALAHPGKRRQCFLMTKCCGRDAATVQQHLDDSLRRLRTEVLDLVQIHEVNYDNDPEWIIERGGLAALLAAQKAGKVRFLGFTGHKAPHIHVDLLGRHAWDTVQMPVNVLDYHYRSFVRQAVPAAQAAGTAVLGMKSLGGGRQQMARFISAGVCTPEEGIRWALSQPIASLVVGIDSRQVLEQNLRIGQSFTPMTANEQSALQARVRHLAGDGRHETFKSTQLHDGPYHRAQHGLTEAEVVAL
jgi:aryl-alcohol dehydrogenase-like predicted oxidoreductase